MASSVLYSPLNKYIETKMKIRHIIPYKTLHSQRYEVGRVYYNDYWNVSFQVLSVRYYENHDVEAEVRWDDGCYGYICTDIQPGQDYLLVKDYKHLHEQGTIINTDQVYTGAEIVYWFYLHGASLLDPIYKDFWQYIDNFSHNRVQDYAKYKLFGRQSPNGAWKQCRVKRIR